MLRRGINLEVLVKQLLGCRPQLWIFIDQIPNDVVGLRRHWAVRHASVPIAKNRAPDIEQVLLVGEIQKLDNLQLVKARDAAAGYVRESLHQLLDVKLKAERHYVDLRPSG